MPPRPSLIKTFSFNKDTDFWGLHNGRLYHISGSRHRAVTKSCLGVWTKGGTPSFSVILGYAEGEAMAHEMGYEVIYEDQLVCS
jgi:hypothetical protein